jgi:RimJ/RimL family protein N-acetyltransferase
MMQIEAYGLQLYSLQKEDAELVRLWRNLPSVRERMFFKEYITEAMQSQWFDTLGGNNIYLMISYKNEKIGVVNVKDIDWDLKTGEAGIFLGAVNYNKSEVPMLAIIAMMDTFFDQYQFNFLRAKIQKNNEKALFLNQSLGYQIVSEDTDCYHLQVSSANYKRAIVPFRKVLKKISEASIIIPTETS